jgi:hypothetical protein
MALNKDQIAQLESTGLVYAGQQVFKPTENIDIVYNPGHAVVMIQDLGMVIQPHEVRKLTRFFSKERIAASQGLQIAINKFKSIIPVDIKEVEKLEISPPKSKLQKFEEENEEVDSSISGTGVQVGIEKLTGSDANPFIEDALENEAKIEQANEDLIQGGANRKSARQKLESIKKKKAGKKGKSE